MHTFETPTAEQIAKHYSAAMDSVNLINDLLAKTDRTDEENDHISRNVEHLEIMVAKDFWTTEDLTPLENAIAAGN
jgi:RecA/RadA recombinase